MARIFTLGDLITRAKRKTDLENSGLLSDAEWKGLFSTAYGEFYEEVVECGARYFERVHNITTVAKQAATGTLVTPAKASLVDAERFWLDDGYERIGFELDVAGTGVTAGFVQVNVSGDTTATQVGDTIAAAINAATRNVDGLGFAITASNAAGTVTLTHDETGEIGNRPSKESVANSGFSLTDMSGGGETYALPADHFSTVGVYYVAGTGTWIPLTERMAQEYHQGLLRTGQHADGYSLLEGYIRLTPFPASGQTYKMLYVPQNPDLTGENDNYPIDVITPSGELFILSHVAVEALEKEDSDVTGHVAARERTRERIRNWARQRSLHSLKTPMMDDQLDGYYDEGDFRSGWGGAF